MLNLSSAPTEICGCYFCFNLMLKSEVKVNKEYIGPIAFCPYCDMDSIMKFSSCLSIGDILIALETKAKQSWAIVDEDDKSTGDHMIEKFEKCICPPQVKVAHCKKCFPAGR